MHGKREYILCTKNNSKVVTGFAINKYIMINLY